jgi:uroporphyrin-III C-methyltransferase
VAHPRPARWLRWSLIALAGLAALGAWSGWSAQQRVTQLESELVKRQQDSQVLAQEAQVLSKQAQEVAREAAARATLLETRLAEVALQRTQVEDLIKSMSRSRDENLLVDIEASLRVAAQQTALTGSAEALVSALQTADERLARAQQPRLDGIRRAVVKDLDRIKSTRVADLPTLAIRLDEAIRMVDDMPLISERATPQQARAERTERAAPQASAASASANVPPQGWSERLWHWGQTAGAMAWQEARALVRVTRIERPESMLLAPDQAFFLRENLKLRLLNARLALLSRQTATALSDVQAAQGMMNRFFDTRSRRVQLTQGLLNEVLAQGAQTQTPRPDDTLAALTAQAALR